MAANSSLSVWSLSVTCNYIQNSICLHLLTIYIPNTIRMKFHLDITGNSIESHTQAPRATMSGFRPHWKSFLASPSLLSARMNQLNIFIKGIGTTWCERRLINKLYMNQSVKLRLTKRKIWSVRTRTGVRQQCCFSPILFNLYNEYLTKKTLEGFGNLEIWGQVIQTVNQADGLVLPAKEETVPQAWLTD